MLIVNADHVITLCQISDALKISPWCLYVMCCILSHRWFWRCWLCIHMHCRE